MPLIQEQKLNKLDSFEIEESKLKNDLERITDQQSKLLEQQTQILSQLSANQRPNKKDFWDRVASIAPILSGTIIALGGTYFTTIYNEQQLKLQEVQTIERFIPHLLGDEKSKRAAVLAISSLGNAKLAARVASIFASPGTVSALESIARNDKDASDKGALNKALDRALDNMAEGYRVEKKYEDAIETYKKVLALREKTWGKNSSRVVPSLFRLSALYWTHGDFREAEVLLTRAVDIQKAEFGRDSMQHAEALRKLASLYSEQGQDSKSRELLNQASAIEQKVPDASKNAAVLDSDADEETLSDTLSGPRPVNQQKARAASDLKPDAPHPAPSGAGEGHFEPTVPSADASSAPAEAPYGPVRAEESIDVHSRPRKIVETQEPIKD